MTDATHWLSLNCLSNSCVAQKCCLGRLLTRYTPTVCLTSKLLFLSQDRSSSFRGLRKAMGGNTGVFGAAELISELCHTNVNSPFPVWQNGTISPCANQLLLGSLLHAVIAITSACYISVPR